MTSTASDRSSGAYQSSRLDLSSVQLFVFDFDGTLVISNAIKRAVFYEVTVNFPNSHRELDDIFRTLPHLNRFGIFSELASRLPDIDANAMVTAYSERCAERILAAPEVRGATALLQALKDSGRTIVINSATPQEPLRSLVSQMSFAHLIDAVYGEPAIKSENLAQAMLLADMRPEQTVVIGDQEPDRAAADSAECLFIGIASDANDYIELPATMITQLDEIISWF